jgi:3-phosphoshikimate 1-carboxyvinyltransferase
MRGVKELRVKESDRIDAMAHVLRAAGVTVEEGPDWWIVHGRGADGVAGGGVAQTRLDHRIAMSALILGLGARGGMGIDDGSPIATSFPVFERLMAGLGAGLERG